MKYATAAAFRAALEARLAQSAVREKQSDLVRLRKLVTFDRLLARLLVVAPDRWVLKGGAALDFRLGNRARTTRDLDIARQLASIPVAEDILALQDVPVDDFFTFVIRRIPGFDPLLEPSVSRFRVHAELAGRTFEEVTMDVSVGDPLIGIPERLHGPDLLAFAGIERTEVPALPLEQHLAEKLHAYTRSYSGDQPSSRVKDLIDLILIASFTGVEAGRLREAIDATFAFRATHPIPKEMPVPPTNWRVPFRQLALAVRLNPEFGEGHRLASALLNPVLRGDVASEAHWDLVTWRWTFPHPPATKFRVDPTR